MLRLFTQFNQFQSEHPDLATQARLMTTLLRWYSRPQQGSTWGGRFSRIKTSSMTLEFCHSKQYENTNTTDLYESLRYLPYDELMQLPHRSSQGGAVAPLLTGDQVEEEQVEEQVLEDRALH